MTVPAASRKVLLVDDDPAMVRLVRKILAGSGFLSVEHAPTGREALTRLEGVDVVLLDHQLPDTCTAIAEYQPFLAAVQPGNHQRRVRQ